MENEKSVATKAPVDVRIESSDESTVTIIAASNVKRWVRRYVLPFGSHVASTRVGASDDVVGVADDRVQMCSGRRIKPATLIYNYDCERFRTDDGLAWRHRKLGGAELATVVEPRAVDPLAGCTRDSELADELEKRSPNVRAAIRLAISQNALSLGGAGMPAPPVHAREEVVSGNPTTVYYLTPEAVRVMKLRLDKNIQAAVNQRVAQGVPALDVDALGRSIATAVTSAMGAMLTPLLDRLLPPTNAPPQLSAGTVVPPAPPGYELTQRRVARRLGLPEAGEGANLVGGWARDEGMYGAAPWSTWVAHGTPDRLIDDAAVRYSDAFLERMRPAASAAAREMNACGYRIADGQLVAFDPKPTTKLVCVNSMRDAGRDALRKAS